MRREQQIPLFLWVATALVVHAVGGGGATEVVQRLEETLDIRSFASEVRRKAKFAGPLEVSVYDEEDAPEDKPPEPTDSLENTDDAPEDEETDQEEEELDQAKKPDELETPPEEKEKEQTREKEDKAEEKLQEKPPELTIAQQKKLDNRRVSVDQHVQDKNQAPNPNAEFAGEHANHVKEQTQARITSSDENAADPTPGGNFNGPDPEPGNSEESRVAQSDENDAPEDRAPSASAAGATPSASASAEKPGQRRSANNDSALRPQEAQDAQKAAQSSDSQDGMAHTHSHERGSWTVAEAQEARKAQKKREAAAALQRVIARQKGNKDPLVGYGSASTTENGVNLNLTPRMASVVIGQDQLDNLKAEVGKRRLSQHRGSWKNIGLEKWKGAIENYVASVKPGNQTALNTAAVPFARYLNQIHQRLHEVFAYGFLGHLEQLPDKHPLNNQEMSTHLEIALSREDGRIVKMGVVKSSGVTAFDVGALESVEKAAPYGPPPGSIVSSDGNVYLHWEFHRKRIYACSTYFAYPYIINVDQKTSPPRVDPPRKPHSDEKKQPDERSGALHGEQDDSVSRRPG